jgi:hypothetical protein
MNYDTETNEHFYTFFKRFRTDYYVMIILKFFDTRVYIYFDLPAHMSVYR